METPVTFSSDGLTLSGIVHKPDNMGAGERRPAFLLLHGFGSSKDSGTMKTVADLMCDWGYVVMRFDFRGCGESEGKKAWILCLDQVEDTRNALTYMMTRDDVDPDRIGVMGHSFGAAVAAYVGGVDDRFAAVVSSCGWGDGEKKFRRQHPTPEAWEKFTKMLADGKRHREEKGESLMVPRWDIVPIPEHLRGGLAPDSIMEFPAETAQSMFDFRANEVVGNIAPRPLLLFHSANDSVTPTEQSIGLFEHARQPTDLILLADVDHFPFSVENTRPRQVLKMWLDQYLPAR